MVFLWSLLQLPQPSKLLIAFSGGLLVVAFNAHRLKVGHSMVISPNDVVNLGCSGDAAVQLQLTLPLIPLQNLVPKVRPVDG